MRVTGAVGADGRPIVRSANQAPRSEARQVLDEQLSEKDWQQQIMDYAAQRGWIAYHTYDSQRSAGGFPDLVMCRSGRQVVAELKTERGRVARQQWRWLQTFAEVRDAEVFIWRPGDWEEVEATLW